MIIYNFERRWLIISVAYLTPYGERTDLQKNLTTDGLCDAAGILGDNVPYDKLHYILPEQGSCSYWMPVSWENDFDENYDIIRGMLAALFSVIGESEFTPLITKE